MYWGFIRAVGVLTAMVVCRAGGAQALEPVTQAPEPVAQAPESVVQEVQEPSPAPPEAITIDAFDVAGNTLLDALTVDATLAPFAGPGKSTADIEAARAALEKQYRDRGYDSVVVQAGEIPDEYAIARILVTETRVGTVSVSGEKYASPRVVRGQLAELKEGTVPNFRTVETQIAEANRHFRNRQLTVLPSAGALPNTIDVNAQVTDTLPMSASLELGNNRNRDTAPLRLAASIGYNDLWRLGHQLSIGYSVAPERPKNSQVFTGSYTAPILGTPWSLSLSGQTSNSNIALALGSQTVIGNGYTIGARAEYQLPVKGSASQLIRFGSDFKNYSQDIFSIVGDEPTQTFPKIRWLTLVGDYVLQRSSERSTTSVSLQLAAGIRAASQQLLSVPNEEAFRPGEPPTVLVPAFAYSRPFARGNFLKLSGEATHTQSLEKDFLIVARLAGQLTDTPLLPNEQFSLGGLFSVRGYLVGEAVGDNGLLGTLEVRTPNFATTFGDFVDDLRVYTFVDGGYVRTLKALPQQNADAKLAGIGFGLHLQIFKLFTGELVLGVPLRDGDVSQSGERRINFSVRAGF